MFSGDSLSICSDLVNARDCQYSDTNQACKLVQFRRLLTTLDPETLNPRKCFTSSDPKHYTLNFKADSTTNASKLLLVGCSEVQGLGSGALGIPVFAVGPGN